METSTAEKHAGMNISYENSFSAIKKDILKETVDKKRQNALTKEVIPIEEKPNKPKDKFIVNTMNNTGGASEPIQMHLNLTQEIKGSTTITVEDMLNKTAAQYSSQSNAIQGRGSEKQTNSQKNNSMTESQIRNLREKTPVTHAS